MQSIHRQSLQAEDIKSSCYLLLFLQQTRRHSYSRRQVGRVCPSTVVKTFQLLEVENNCKIPWRLASNAPSESPRVPFHAKFVRFNILRNVLGILGLSSSMYSREQLWSRFYENS